LRNTATRRHRLKRCSYRYRAAGGPDLPAFAPGYLSCGCAPNGNRKAALCRAWATWITSFLYCTGCGGNGSPNLPGAGRESPKRVRGVCFLVSGEARPYARYFTGSYKFDSFVVYAYGRPRFAAWAQLGKEVEDAATGLGIPIAESCDFQRCPALRNPRARSRSCLRWGSPSVV
jgi:hypothetical protein